MKVNNIGLGLIFLVLAMGLGVAGVQLPNPSRQIYGPGFLPTLLAVLLAITALVLIFEGLRQRDGRLVELQPWTRDPVLVMRFAAVPAAVALYIFCVGFVGFLPTVTLILLGLFLILGVRLVAAIPVAVATALAVHSLFYLGLRVQLPWGLLEPIRW